MLMNDRKEEHEEKGMPILVINDANDGHKGTGMAFAHVVPSKGVDTYVVRRFSHDIGLLGHLKMIIADLLQWILSCHLL